MNPQEEDLVEAAIDLHNEQMEVIPPQGLCCLSGGGGGSFRSSES